MDQEIPKSIEVIVDSPQQKMDEFNPFKNRNCCECQVNWYDATFPKEADIQSWACFEDINDGEKTNVFCYSLAGLFQLKTDKLFQPGDHLCCQCLAKYSHEEYRQAECAFCHKIYPSLSNEEGWNCATTFDEGHLYPGYGSNYDDGHSLKFDNNIPTSLKDQDTVCDDCIDTWIKEGKILYTPYEYDPSSHIPINMGSVPSLNNN